MTDGRDCMRWWSGSGDPTVLSKNTREDFVRARGSLNAEARAILARWAVSDHTQAAADFPPGWARFVYVRNGVLLYSACAAQPKEDEPRWQ